MPALGLSLFLVALGAILAFAVRFSVTGVDLSVVGVILMVVGLVGMVMSLLFWTSFAPFRRTEIDVTHDVVDHRR